MNENEWTWLKQYCFCISYSFIYFGQIISAIKIIMYIVGHDKLTHQIWYEFEPVKVANQEKIGSVSLC